MNPIQSNDTALSNLLRRIALASNNRVSNELFWAFQRSFPEGFPFANLKITNELTRHFLLAGERLRRMNDVPRPLQILMERVQNSLYDSLQINPVLASHLQKVGGFESSCVDKFIAAVNLRASQVTYSDLKALFGSDWGWDSNNSIYGAMLEPRHTLGIFYKLIGSAADLNAGPHSKKWKQFGIFEEGLHLNYNLKLAKKGKLQPPTADELEELKNAERPLYFPIGYANQSICFLSLIAIDHIYSGYRLRLLTCDNSNILAAGDKPEHYCSEVVFEGLDLKVLTNSELWKPLFEAATLTEQEVVHLGRENDSYHVLAFNSTHLVPWLIRRLGKRPHSALTDIHEDSWKEALKSKYRHPKGVWHNIKYFPTPSNDKEGDLLLKPTSKQIKRTLYSLSLRKFVNLLPSDLLRSRNDILLFKAESRLLLLVGAYTTLKESALIPNMRGNMFRLIEESFGKVTAPIEKLMMGDPSSEERNSARILLATLLDLKHRLADVARSMDHIPLTAPRPLYRSMLVLHQLNLSTVVWESIQYRTLDVLRLNVGVAPVTLYRQWNSEHFPEIYASLEKWYDVLLDVKQKCEPAEILTLAHKNIFSRLPIPSTDSVEDTFPEDIPEGLQVGTLLLLKKISSLVASEVYSDVMVSPIFVTDMARVYRFSVELYRKINPAVRKLPISWFSLYQYIESRHSFHAPGEVKATLEALEASFKIISPKGHLRPSEEFTEIPLFYYSWWEFPKHYTFHRKSLGPLRLYNKSVEEVLTMAELADSVGLRPEDVEKESNCVSEAGSIKWQNSFSGQCVLTLKEIAQYFTMSIFGTIDAYREALKGKDYREYHLHENLGPEDHFQLEPPKSNDFIENHNQFAGSGTKFCEQVESGDTPMSQRMVLLHDKLIREPISDLPIRGVKEWRDQADLIKAMPKRNAMRGIYHLHQAASGPSTLSLDVLLEFFEARRALLLSLDYRSYFWAVVRSANITETACSNESLLLDRLEAFITSMAEEDRCNLNVNNLNFERMLWLSSLTRYLCHIGEAELQKFSPLLQKILEDLRNLGEGQRNEVRLAPHLLAGQYLLKSFKLTIPEIARLHLVIGRQPPKDPNEAVIWLEACEAMQAEAPRIQAALLHGDEATRRTIWKLIFSSEADVEEAMQRQPQKMSIETLAKTAAQHNRLNLKGAYLMRWQKYWKKYHWRHNAWREEATNKVFKRVIASVGLVRFELSNELKQLHHTVEKLFCASATTLIVDIGNHLHFVDWETGRITGSGNNLPLATTIPVYLRKHPDLASIGDLLRRPIVRSLETNRVQFQGNSLVSLDIPEGTAWIRHEDHDYRLISNIQLLKLGLPDQIGEGFSVWLNEQHEGIIAAHSQDGTPYPAFRIDSTCCIRSIQGNTNLRLAKAGYYPEAEIFARWSLPQNNILIWLDDENNVAEMHIPLHNGEANFTRVIRMDDGGWKIDGLEVRLEATTEAIPAFAGHPVYLVAKNSQGQRLLLLPGATPYEQKKRREKNTYVIDWNTLLASGEKEGIHQYRIMPSGQIEGLKVADNLLLMLWTLYMGQYAATAVLAQRWLTPPGRPYTDDEQRILLTWIKSDYGDHPMKEEAHPSALSIRLYVILRMARHLRDFSPARGEGEKMSKLWRSLIGPRCDSYLARADIKENLMQRGTLGRQVRGTSFDGLITAYDHEAGLRLILKDERKDSSAVARRLHQRLSSIRADYEKDSTGITCKIYGQEIHNHSDDPMWGKYTFKSLCELYPTTKQTDVVPVDQLYRSIIPTYLPLFFDKAYTLIKEGAQSEGEVKAYSAMIHALGQLHGPKSIDLCMGYLYLVYGFCSDTFYDESTYLWLLLEQAFLAQIEGYTLPELPTVERRFGLVIEGSQESSKKFFRQLLEFSGMEPGEFLQSFRKKWFAEREMRYLEQETVYVNPPHTFLESIQKPWSDQLTTEITRWSKLASPLKLKDNNLDVRLSGWTYSIPEEWTKIPLDTLQEKLQERLNGVSKDKAEREKTLLALANQLPDSEEAEILMFANQIHYVAPRTIDECIGLALIGQRSRWKSSCLVVDPVELQRTTLLYLEVALEEAHLERAKTELEMCLKNPEDEERVQLLLESLTTAHHYIPSTETVQLMAAEYYSNCRLRTNPDQANLIEVLSSENGKGSVIQAIMGSGKSKMLAPAWLQKMLGTGRIPILCVPSSLFRTTLSDLQNMMWSRFRTHVRAFTFDRESCTNETLHALAEMLHVARLEPTVFVTAPRDLHALQLMLKERHQVIEDMRERLQRFTLIWSQSCFTPQEQLSFSLAVRENNWIAAQQRVPENASIAFNRWFESHKKLEEELKPLVEESNLLQSILNLLQYESALLVDEVATAYDPRNLLSFPIGWQTQANPQAAAMACKIYFEWLPKYYDKLDMLNNMQSLTKEITRQEIYRRIAKTAWKEYKELLPELPSLNTFIYYMLSKPKHGREMQAYVNAINEGNSVLKKQYAQELAFLKYSLTSGLEGAFTSTGHVNYGRSKQDPQLHLAIPYQCANVPKENTLFRRPWKTVLMTCQLYTQAWQDPLQTAELIGFLQGIDPASKDHSILEAAVKIWGRRFGDIDLSDIESMKELTIELDLARLNPEKAKAARLLIQTYLQSCVFPTQLKLDPSQLTSTPQDIPMVAAKSDAMGGTFGFETTWNPKLARKPDLSCDESILRGLAEKRNQTCHILPKGGAEAFFKHIQTGSLDGYMALVDAGAIFKGITNSTVAKRLLSSLKGFDCILYYDEEQPGGARLAVMSNTCKTILEHSDREGVRRALSQLKLSAPFAYYDQDRRIGTDLELKHGRALLTFSNIVTLDDLLQSAMRCRRLLDGFHSIAYVIPGEMEGDWIGDKVIQVAREQQKCVEKKANFHGICEQMRGAVRAVIDQAMRQTADAEKRHEIHKAAKTFLMEEQDNDLVKTFGSLQKKIKISKALLRLKRHLVNRVEKVLPKSSSDLEKTLKAILVWHEERGTTLPETVREGDEQEDAVQEVDLSKDQDRMRLMEEEYERMLGTRNPKKEIEWSHFYPALIRPSPLGSIAEINEMPPLYSLKEALKERGFTIEFDKNLLVSANLLSTFLGEANCLLTENQKPVHRGLFIRGTEDSQFVLVTEGDARFLKEHLLRLPENQGKGIYIVEPTGAINQRGDRAEKIVNLWKEGTIEERSLLLQVLVYQGSALQIDQLPVEELSAALKHWTQQKRSRITEVRTLFEAAADLRPDDMMHYRRSQKLRALFH